MKLYRILERHCAPKDCSDNIRLYVLANDERRIMERVDNGLQYGKWHEREEEGETFAIYDTEYDEIGQETFLELMLRIRGEFNWEDVEYNDLYYGLTLLGWDKGVEIDMIQAQVLLTLGIAEDWR